MIIDISTYAIIDDSYYKIGYFLIDAPILINWVYIRNFSKPTIRSKDIVGRILYGVQEKEITLGRGKRINYSADLVFDNASINYSILFRSLSTLCVNKIMQITSHTPIA